MTGDLTHIDPSFRQELESIEHVTGIKLHITSGYRTPTHNATVGGTKDSAHTEQPCRAADIQCEIGWHRYALLREAFSRGIPRIGIGKTFLHLDRSPHLPQRVVWHYYERKT